MRDYANTIHRTRLIIVVVPVVMRPRPSAHATCIAAIAGSVYVEAGVAKRCMPLGDMMPGVAVKCCNATSCR